MIRILLGAMLPVQAGMNTELARLVMHLVHSAVVSFGVSTVALSLLILTGISWPSSRMFQASLWVCLGGFLGAAHVVGVIALAPSLGALLTLAGQPTASSVLDHLELLYPKHPVNLPRILIGMPLLRRY